MAGVRTTIVIDPQLLDEAREALGTRSIRETVEIALREATRRKRLEELAESIREGGWEIEMTLQELLRLREES